MGRSKEPAEEARETTPIKVYKDTYRLLKIVAELKELSALEYFDLIAREALARDLPLVQANLKEIAATFKK
jgi:hypothetical protein